MPTLVTIGIIILLLSPAAHSEPMTAAMARMLAARSRTAINGRSPTPRGQFAGSSITHGNMTTYFDKAGKFQGSTIRQGTPSNPLPR
jgi:hypothetical protein